MWPANGTKHSKASSSEAASSAPPAHLKRSSVASTACEAIQLGMGLASQNSNTAEHQALADAKANLQVLRRELLPATSNRKEIRFPVSDPEYGCD